MSWTNKTFSSNGEGSLANKMTAFLNELGPREGASAKAAMCNSADKDPKGAIFYFQGNYDQAPNAAGSWSTEKLEGPLEDISTQTTERLNSLPFGSADATQVTLSRKKSANPTITMFIPAIAATN